MQLPAVGIAAELKRRPHVLIADQSYVSQVCCSVLQCAAVRCNVLHYEDFLMSQSLSLLIADPSYVSQVRVLQSVAVRCSVLQCVQSYVSQVT